MKNKTIIFLRVIRMPQEVRGIDSCCLNFEIKLTNYFRPNLAFTCAVTSVERVVLM